MTVVVKATKSPVTQPRGKAESGLKADEKNEFNLQTNKERKKVGASGIL